MVKGSFCVKMGFREREGGRKNVDLVRRFSSAMIVSVFVSFRVFFFSCRVLVVNLALTFFDIHGKQERAMVIDHSWHFLFLFFDSFLVLLDLLSSSLHHVV